MKKLIFLLLAVMTLVMLPTSEVTAQRSHFNAESYVTDTVTNTTPEYADFGRMSLLWDYVVFATADKLTGTVSGAITLQVSPDGTNWITHPTADTLTYTDVSDGMLTSVITGTDLPYPYLRAKVLGTGTSTSVWTLDVILKK